MRNSRVWDRFLGAAVLLALLALFAAGAMILADQEPRVVRMTLILPGCR